MEINKFPPPIITPARPTSTVDDGDVGQNGNWHGRSRKNKNRKHDADEPLPQLGESSSLIDIRV